MLLLIPDAAMAHCDGMDGPVVKAAQRALASGDVDLVLVWVRPQDEDEIRRAFARTLQVRELGAEARELADVYFFETLVRIHRAGEGAPYTGLKPAGRDLGPAIPLADEVLAGGDIDTLVELLTDEVRHGVTERFHHAREARDYMPSDVDAGRNFVHAYVTFIHYVEGIYEAAQANPAGHFEEH
jgi:hypothetical protein